MYDSLPWVADVAMLSQLPRQVTPVQVRAQGPSIGPGSPEYRRPNYNPNKLNQEDRLQEHVNRSRTANVGSVHLIVAGASQHLKDLKSDCAGASQQRWHYVDIPSRPNVGYS